MWKLLTGTGRHIATMDITHVLARIPTGWACICNEYSRGTHCSIRTPFPEENLIIIFPLRSLNLASIGWFGSAETHARISLSWQWDKIKLNGVLLVLVWVQYTHPNQILIWESPIPISQIAIMNLYPPSLPTFWKSCSKRHTSSMQARDASVTPKENGIRECSLWECYLFFNSIDRIRQTKYTPGY